MAARTDRVIELVTQLNQAEAEAKRLRAELDALVAPKTNGAANGAPRKKTKKRSRSISDDKLRSEILSLLAKGPQTIADLTRQTRVYRSRVDAAVDEILETNKSIDSELLPMPNSNGRVRVTTAYGRKSHLSKLRTERR